MLSHVVTSKVQCFQFKHHEIYTILIFNHFRDFPATKIIMIDSIYDSFWVNNQMLEIVPILQRKREKSMMNIGLSHCLYLPLLIECL